MESKRELAMVGLFVLLATTVLVATMFALGGAFGSAGISYRARFKNAGGLEPGSIVRYAGIKVGRLEKLRIDEKDPTRVEMSFSVARDTPVKADSIAKIASLSALGENFLEILAGTPEKPNAPEGTVLTSKEFFGITDIADVLNDLGPSAQELVENLNSRVVELKTTLERVNDLLSDKNRANLSAALGQVNGLLAEDRPVLHSTLKHMDETVTKLPALIEDFKKTSARADETLAKINAMLGENRADLHAAIVGLRKTMAEASVLIAQLGRTTNANADNLDEIMENVRILTENLKGFTEEIRTRPYSLIRSTAAPDHVPGKPVKP
jgi:phospholipid/cholesterol/gamma-HCH transport system substrate-binding protein